MAPDALILLVNYRHEDEVVTFIREQLLQQEQVELTIVVCDNGSTDSDGFRKQLSAWKQVHYFSAGTNLGYFGGAAAGLKYFTQTIGELPSWTIVCNTDVELPGRDFLYRLFSLSRGALVAAPAVHSTLSGHQQNPFREQRVSLSYLKFMRAIYSFYPLYFLYQLLAYVKRFFRRARTAEGVTRNVYAVHGTFFAFHRTFFAQGGSLQYGSLLFGEELFVAEQLAGMQSACRYVPELQIEHREHASTGRFKSPGMVKYMKESTDYLIREVYRG